MNVWTRAGLWCVFLLSLAAGAAAQIRTYEPLVTGMSLQRLTAGPDGALYAAGNGTIVRITTSGSTSVYAGTSGTPGYLDGPRLSARIGSVTGIAFDPQGRLVFADGGNSVIRRIESDDTITTIAGTPNSSGFVNGPALSARFYSPRGVGVAADGTIYIVDTYNYVIRKLATDGTVSTFAGNGGWGSTDGTGAAARFSNPEGLLMAPNGDFYVSDNSSHKIRKVTPAAVVTTVAGNGQNGSQDGPALTTARFAWTDQLALMSDGTLLITDGWDALRSLKNGVVSTIAGNYSTAGNRSGTGTYSRFSNPTGVAVVNDVIYVTDGNNILWRGGPALTDRPAVDLNPAPYLEERQLSVSNPSATTFEWSLQAKPAGSQVTLASTSETPAITPDYSGTYSIQLIARSPAGATIAPLDLVATCNDAPTPDIVSTADPSCPGSPVTLDAGPGYTEYRWSTGATTRTITVNPTFDTTYSVTGLVGTCVSATDSFVQDVFAPATWVTLVTNGPMNACGANSSSWIEVYPKVGSSSTGDVESYQWGYRTTAGGPITPMTGETNERYDLSFNDFPAQGEYRVVCVVKPPCGPDIITADTVVRVYPPLTVSFTPAQTYFCTTGGGNGTPVNISAQASGANGGPYSYHWRRNGFAYRSDYQLTGPSTIPYDGQVWSVQIYAASGCEINVSVPATASPVPSTPSITSSAKVCAGGSRTLYVDNPSYPGVHYVWSNGATGTQITVTEPGTYSVTRIQNVSGCSAQSSGRVIDFYEPPPVPQITASGPTAFCQGGSVTLTAPAGYSYTWSTGATTQSINVSASGNYSVTVRNANNCSTASAPVVVTVNPLPDATVTPSGPTTFCEGGSVTLTAPDGLTYLWSNGATSRSITATASGAYSVAVTNANGCSTTSTAINVTVNPLPNTTVTASGPTSFCEGGSVTLTAPAGLTYLWSTGATTRSITVSAAGSYGVTLTNANGCTASPAPVPVTVNALPDATVTPSGPAEFCEGGSVTLTAPEGNTYLWSNGATTQSITVFASGSYGVTVTNANGCSTTSTPATVAVNPLPDATVSASGPVTFCEGGTVTLTAPAGLTYLWSNGATTRSIAVSASGSYGVTVTNANGCSATSAATNVTVNALPEASVTAAGPTTFCEGGSVTLTAPAGQSYAWSNGATSQSIAVTAAGSYSVTVTNANGCSATSSATNVTVNALPDATVTASGPVTFCEGGSVTLTAPEGLTYLWSNGATTRSITVSASGSYGVTVTNGNGCSAASAATNVTVNALPEAAVTASGATTFCEGGSVTLTAPAGLTYLWSNGATSQAITVFDSGSYSVTVTNANGCSATSAATSVSVNALPDTTVTASGPATFCEGGSVTLTAPEGLTYLWSNGATSQAITVFDSGSYSVAVTNGNGCSATSAAAVVTVNALPDATVTASGPTTFCEGGSVTLTAPEGLTYLWSNGATTRSITVSGSGSYGVTVTNAAGCSTASASTIVTVNALPEAPVTASGPTTFCEGGSVTLTAPADLSYLWSNGATTQSITVSTSGSYGVTVTNANGCGAASPATAVTVNALPDATVTASGPTAFCEGGSVTLTAPAGLTYLWSNGATSQSITVSTSGSYGVTVTNANGCTATSAATAVTVNALPDASVTASGPTTFCEGGSVTLTAPAGLSYLWSNGATTQSITVSASGNYSVTVTNGSGCSASSSATSVTVNALPDASVTASGPTAFCEGGSVTLTAPAGLTYLWSNGATSQSITVSASGSYGVTVTNANGCSAPSSATTVTVNALPDATVTASGPTTFCEGGSVTLTAPAGLTYLWSNGATSQSITVSTSGSYGVTVTNTNGCSATSSATAVTVNALPDATVTASGPTAFCEGGSVTLTAPAGLTYLWSNGATSQSITVSASGSYGVTVTNGNGCSATSAATAVTVNALPDATVNASGPTTFCEGGSVTLTAPAGLSYLWSNGATTQSINVSASGNYSVTVTNGSGCSASSSATSVTVNALPDASVTASGPTTFCAGGSVTLTAPAGLTYLWSTGATSQSITVSASGSYGVTVTNANGCSTTSATTTVTVNALPDATVTSSGPTTFCEGGSVTLTAPAGLTYLWSNGATSQSISVSAPGSYSVTVTNANGCSATSAATSVTVNANPAATIAPSGPTTFCQGGNVTLTASSGTSYLWSNGATTQSINVTDDGAYTVTVTNASGCSTTSAATSVMVNALPDATVTVSGPTTFCEGGNVTLTAPAGLTYLWSTGATTQSINVTDDGSYSVTVTNANGCSATSAATSVTVNANPAATVTPSGPTTFCQGGSVTLSAPAGLTYLWSTGATTQSINVTAGGGYSVTVTNANGCSTTSAATSVTVNPLPSATVTPSGPTTFCQGGSVTLSAPAGLTYQWSTGATTQSINVTAAGSYSVTVTNANGCSATSAATNVTVNPLPSATVTPSGPTTFCQGGSVTLSAPAGLTYLWSTGATTQAINVTAAGSYSVTVTNANGCSATSAATSVTVNALPSATVTPSGPTTFCQGGSVTLSAPAGLTYLWSTGATTQAINVTAAGSYSVTVTNANGCSATSAATNVTVNALPAVPTITAGGPTTFCPGGSVTLTAPAGFTYLWSNGATTRAITVSAAGSYSVTVTNANGCSRTSAATTVSVSAATAISQQPQSQTIPRNTNASLSVTATGTGTLTYQWYRGTSGNTSNPVSGATSSSYTTPRLGKGTHTYWVRVTGSCGQVNSATATITAP